MSRESMLAQLRKVKAQNYIIADERGSIGWGFGSIIESYEELVRDLIFQLEEEPDVASVEYGWEWASNPTLQTALPWIRERAQAEAYIRSLNLCAPARLIMRTTSGWSDA